MLSLSRILTQTFPPTWTIRQVAVPMAAVLAVAVGLAYGEGAQRPPAQAAQRQAATPPSPLTKVRDQSVQSPLQVFQHFHAQVSRSQNGHEFESALEQFSPPTSLRKKAQRKEQWNTRQKMTQPFVMQFLFQGAQDALLFPHGELVIQGIFKQGANTVINFGRRGHPKVKGKATVQAFPQGWKIQSLNVQYPNPKTENRRVTTYKLNL